MTSGVYKRGRRKATITETDGGRFVLDVDERVKVSNHRNVFKARDMMVKYLDWLFDGKYEIRAED